MSSKEELHQLLDLLSEYECQHLLSTVQNITVGNRFWESDLALLYNEHVKVHAFSSASDPSTVIPAAPIVEREYFVPIPLVKAYPGAQRIELPHPQSIQTPLGETLLRRRSRRNYSSAPMSLNQLSALLGYSCGTTGFVAAYDYAHLPLRSFPSTGGLQSPEVYLAVQAVDDIQPGLYHYHPLDHVLELLKADDCGPAMRNVALGQPGIEEAAVVFALTGYYERLRWKYGERAYRYLGMDIGCLSENLYLVAETLGLGACAIAGFIDGALEELLDINGQDEIALLLMTVGVIL